MQNNALSAESQERWAAWWEFDMVDRPLLLAGYPAENPEPARSLPEGRAFPAPLPKPEDPEELRLYNRWFDIDDHISRNLRNFARRVPALETTLQLDTGWSVAYCLPFGVRAEYNERAAWCEPLPGRDCSSGFAYDYGGEWHRWLSEGTRRMAEAGRGLYYVTPVMWGNHAGDTLSNLVGLDQLMYDCADRPNDVIRALRQITEAQIRVFQELREHERLTGLPGTRNYTGTWSPKTGLGFDCDISAMVSPDMYKSIFLPPLLEIMETVDHRIYHLDGPVCLQHLDTLLSLPQLHAIQWVCGAGNEGLGRWYDLYRKIQAAGKSIIVYASYDEVPEVCRQLKPEGLAISFEPPSKEKMLEMLEKIEKMYKT